MEDSVESSVEAHESVWTTSMFKKQFEEELEKKYAVNHMIVKWDRAQRILAFLKGAKDTAKFKQTITNAGYQRLVIPSGSDDEQEEEILFRKVNVYISENDPASAKDTSAISMLRRVAIYEDFFDIITQFHGTERQHMGMERTWKAVADQYTCLPRAAVRLYVEMCPNCHPERAKEVAPPLQPILSPMLNARCESQPAATSNTTSSASPTEATTVASALPPPSSSAPAAAHTSASRSPELNSTPMNYRLAAAEKVLNKKRKTTDDLGQDLTEYQRQKLQKMDIQNQLLKTLCTEVKQLRSELIATYDIKITQGSK